jgi:hypothetical protein
MGSSSTIRVVMVVAVVVCSEVHLAEPEDERAAVHVVFGVNDAGGPCAVFLPRDFE